MKVKIINDTFTDMDEDTLHLIEHVSLSIDAKGYVVAWHRQHKKKYYLHRLIMNVTERHIFVDHINGNRQDNRKENLRLANNSQNIMNSKPQIKANGLPKGVYKEYSGKNIIYRARIKIDGRHIHLGIFDTIEEAAKAREAAEEKYFGEFRYGK